MKMGGVSSMFFARSPRVMPSRGAVFIVAAHCRANALTSAACSHLDGSSQVGREGGLDRQDGLELEGEGRAPAGGGAGGQAAARHSP